MPNSVPISPNIKTYVPRYTNSYHVNTVHDVDGLGALGTKGIPILNQVELPKANFGTPGAARMRPFANEPYSESYNIPSNNQQQYDRSNDRQSLHGRGDSPFGPDGLSTDRDTVLDYISKHQPQAPRTILEANRGLSSRTVNNNHGDVNSNQDILSPAVPQITSMDDIISPPAEIIAFRPPPLDFYQDLALSRILRQPGPIFYRMPPALIASQMMSDSHTRRKPTCRFFCILYRELPEQTMTRDNFDQLRLYFRDEARIHSPSLPRLPEANLRRRDRMSSSSQRTQSQFKETRAVDRSFHRSRIRPLFLAQLARSQQLKVNQGSQLQL